MRQRGKGGREKREARRRRRDGGGPGDRGERRRDKARHPPHGRLSRLSWPRRRKLYKDLGSAVASGGASVHVPSTPSTGGGGGGGGIPDQPRIWFVGFGFQKSNHTQRGRETRPGVVQGGGGM